MKTNPYVSPKPTEVATAAESSKFRSGWVCVAFVSVAGIFAWLSLMLALLCLLAGNAIAMIALLVAEQTVAAGLAFLTGLFLIGTLLCTDWGFSRPEPRIVIAWYFFILMCLSQLALILMPFWRAKSRDWR